MPPRDPRAAQLPLILASCCAPLRALGWNVPDDHDLTPQATGCRMDQLRQLIGMVARSGAVRRVLGSGLELGRPDALDALQISEDVPEGALPRVTTLRPAREVELGDLETIAAACRDAGMSPDGAA